MNEQQADLEKMLEVGILTKPDKISPSTMSNFIERRSAWYMSKVAGMSTFTTSDYLQRGKAIEAGLQCLLQGGNEEDAMAIGLKELWDFPDGDLNESQLVKMQDHAASLGAYLQCCWTNYQKFQFLGLKSAQAKVSLQPDFCSFELYGYVDFLWSKLWTDLKVLSQTPSKLSQGYCVQGAIYDKATGQPGVFTIVARTNPKAGPVYRYSEQHIRKQEKSLDWWWAYVRMAAIAMEGVYDCALSGDVDNLIKHMSFPNLESFYGENDINDALKFWSKL